MMSAVTAERRPARASSMIAGTSTLTGTGRLIRFYLRRDRVRIPVWVGSVALLYLYATVALGGIYTTQADRQSRAQLMSSPAAIMMTGPGYGTEHYTLGAMVANEMTLSVLIAVAIMNILLIVRHTRMEEETGRAELVRAAVVGRHAPIMAAFCTAAIANVAIAAFSWLALTGAGLAAVDSLAESLAVGLLGMAFAGVTVIVSQITEHTRGAEGFALLALGAFWLIDAGGNIEEKHGAWFVWLSPLGWAQQIRAYVDLRWWPLIIPLVFSLVTLWIGIVLASRRDVGAGLRAPSAGRPDAPATLAGPFALSWRLQRATVWAWVAGVGVLAYVCGTFVNSVTTMLDQVSQDNNAIKQILGERNPVDGFISVVTLYLIIAISAFAVQSALRGRSEETAGRAEPLLATGVGRERWLGAQLGVTAIGTVLVLVVSGVGLGLGALSVGYTGTSVWEFLAAHLVYLPGIAVIVGLAWALYGWFPRLAGLASVLVMYAFVVGLFGTLFKLPDWALNISPLYKVPQIPYQSFDAAPELVLTAIAVVLFAAGFAGFRRRDVG